MPQEEREAILDELKGGGFGAEIKARRIFADEGFDSRAFYFFDKDGGKTREMDIFAQRKGGVVTTHSDFHYLVIGEVKSGYTWILSDMWDPTKTDVEGAFEGPLPTWFSESPKGEDKSILEAACRGSDFIARHISYSIHQRRVDGQDAWYEAAIKVTKASADTATPSLTINGEVVVPPNFFIIIPLIVLEGNLLAAIDGGNGLEIEPRDHAQVRFMMGGADNRQEDVFIHVVTMEGLPAFLKCIMNAERKASMAANRLYRQVKTKDQT